MAWKNLPKEWITEAPGSSAPIYYLVLETSLEALSYIFLASCCKLIFNSSCDILEEIHPLQFVSVLVPHLFRQNQFLEEQVNCTAACKLQARDGADSDFVLMAIREWCSCWKKWCTENYNTETLDFGDSSRNTFVTESLQLFFLLS